MQHKNLWTNTVTMQVLNSNEFYVAFHFNN